ncbi:unnamed protein product [Bubo scandiacus]
MATASEDRCPICLITLDNAALTMPCLHRFCFSCIQRWAEIKPECPLCRGMLTSILYSLPGEDCRELLIRQPSLALLGSAQNEAPFRLPDPRASRLNQRLHLEPWFIGGLYPYTGQSIFREHPDVLRLLWSWLHQELGCTFELERRQVLTLAQRILHTLPILGLREERLLEIVQRHLGSRTTAFTQGLIRVIMQWCGRASHQLLLSEESPGFQERGELSPVASTSAVPARGGTPEPGPAPSATAATADADELLGTSTAALQGGPSCPPAPSPGEQEELQREPGEAAARVSAPRQARGSSRHRHRSAQKRKASTTSSDSSSRAKKPPRR